MKPWVRRLFSTLALVLLTSYLFGLFDYWQVRQGESPWFTFKWDVYPDGGSYAGGGFGYSLRSFHGTLYSLYHGPHAAGWDWAEGPEIHFWLFPFLDRSEVTVIKHIGSPNLPP